MVSAERKKENSSEIVSRLGVKSREKNDRPSVVSQNDGATQYVVQEPPSTHSIQPSTMQINIEPNDLNN